MEGPVQDEQLPVKSAESSTRSSPAFRQWLQGKDPEQHLRLGVSFRHLHAYGFMSSERYQETFTSYGLTIPRLVANLLSARNNAPQRVQILHDFDGLINRGEMLLVLGRPGSGCSTFLKTLSGDAHGFHIAKTSEINYEGISYDQMRRTFKGESIYLAELDVHFPELTLGQTLSFAASTREKGADRNAISSKVGRNVASLFSLDGAIDTKVGDAMIRGLSGGEKKRTSLAEAFISGAPFQCWDNSTRGLDSSTALAFIELLRGATDALQSTVVMSIYQASESMYKNFDKVTLLYEGRQIYFGPIDAAAAYFTNLGFVRPSRATTPDFLTSLTNPVERIIQPGFEDKVPRSPDEFASIWKKSAELKALLEEISAFNSAHPLQGKDLGEDSEKVKLRASTYTIPIPQQLSLSMQRAVNRIRNNPAPMVSAIIANAILGLLIGSVYYNLPHTAESMDTRSVLLFFALMVLAFAPAFEVITMWAQRPIVEKHHRYAMYHPFIESVASMISDLPNKFAISVMFSLTVYFMANLRRSVGAYFVFYLFSVTIYIVNSCYFRMVGSLSKTLDQTMPPSAIMVSVLITYTGFIIPADYMVPWLGWLRWINPVAYIFESWMINEFDGRLYPCLTTIPNGPAYSEVGMKGKICTTIGAQPGKQEIQGADYLFEKYGYVPNHLWRNFGILIAMGAFFCICHLLAAEYIPAERSKGEILLFRKQNISKTKRRTDKDVDGNETGGSTIFAQDINQSEDSDTDGKKDKTHTTGTEKRGDDVDGIQRQTAVFHWNDLCYDIKAGGNTKKILNCVDGWVKPGTLTALMGVTGAGKTSLLDVLACRATVGVITGDVHIDGRLRDAGFQRRIGYVQQEDIHLPTATVREALNFSAIIRQGGERSTEEKLAYVDTVLKMLDMTPYADAVVGIPGEGLNVEQRKRLTIAVEMVARPELLLFLDEPTSGLDSQTAWSICTLLRKLADNGQAILCTIHQPSSQIFQSFDRLLLLGRGGETMYFGEIGKEASALIGYFETHGAPKCPPDANPAEWVLDVTKLPPGISSAGSDSEASSQEKSEEKSEEESGEKSDSSAVVATDTNAPGNDIHHAWFEKWKTSHQRQEVLAHLEELKNAKKSTDSAPTEVGKHVVKDEYAATWFQQLRAVTYRLFQEFWRDPIFLWSKLGVCVGLALLNGLSFLNTRLTLQGLTGLLFSVFSLCQIFGTLDQQLIARFCSGRALFEARERRSKSYSWTVFISANIIVEIFWQTIAAVLVFAVWYYPTGLWRHTTEDQNTRGFLVFFIVWNFMVWLTTFSQAMAAGIELPDVAIQIATLLFWLSMLFCGVVIFPSALPRFWIFMYRLSPLTYFIDAIVLAGFVNTHIECSATELRRIEPILTPLIQTCGEYLAPYIAASGGYVANPLATTICELCPIADTNPVLALFGMEPVEIGTAWRNAGIMMGYSVFNIMATFGIYWLARVPRKSSGLA
ncbi:AtrD, ABC-transporter [Podospora didyma]|uniref:AtrD, ABC-transporter n=1 Tax=Podospora didyma TaxID=330526 RepID=A0AAE0P403_9PEZI|nr:AtrD, ABC-transporter [Podospora didyma]